MIRLITQTDRTLAREGRGRHKKTPERSGRRDVARGSASPTLRSADLLEIPITFSFTQCVPTELNYASTPPINVGLI
jgi:hypothetical protein